MRAPPGRPVPGRRPCTASEPGHAATESSINVGLFKRMAVAYKGCELTDNLRSRGVLKHGASFWR
eukprot:3827150-Alexandrium_andersonii.AAC.1